eukprot:GFYU01032536.1.p1 GENE.GFYU01032536.1~~GFYU01032536.1.p1  ORF type:complete len:189 (+),score=33.38 GFYU01032536.1:66-569(+)
MLEETIVTFYSKFAKFASKVVAVCCPDDNKSSLVENIMAFDLDNHRDLQELYDLLYFECHYVTDELVFYGLKGTVGQFVYPLAVLMYRVLFQNELFVGIAKQRTASRNYPQFLWRLVEQLQFFLSYFPTPGEHLDALRELMNSLVSQETPHTFHRQLSPELRDMSST